MKAHPVIPYDRDKLGKGSVPTQMLFSALSAPFL